MQGCFSTNKHEDRLGAHAATDFPVRFRFVRSPGLSLAHSHPPTLAGRVSTCPCERWGFGTWSAREWFRVTSPRTDFKSTALPVEASPPCAATTDTYDTPARGSLGRDAASSRLSAFALKKGTARSSEPALGPDPQPSSSTSTKISSRSPPLNTSCSTPACRK